MLNKDWLSVYGPSHSLSLSYQGKLTEQRIDLSNDDIYVRCCEFFECKAENANGGAIYVSHTDNTKMLIEKSMFYCCQVVSANYYGGAICFENKGSCALSKVCGYRCSAVSNRLFAYICCTNDLSYLNQANDSAISCITNNECTNAFSRYYGSIISNGLNSSFNKCKTNSGCFCHGTPPTEENLISCLLCYSSFVNDSSTSYRIIVIDCSTAIFCIDSCNIVKNEHSSSTAGIVESYGNTTIKRSCIIQNSAAVILYEATNECQIKVTNCTLDDDIGSKISGNVVITEMPEKPFINHLVHFSSGNCKAETAKRTKSTECTNYRYFTDNINTIFIFTLSFVESN